MTSDEIIRRQLENLREREDESVPLSDYDKAHIGDLVAGEGNWFSAHLLRLIARADSTNRARLGLLYPEHVEAFEEWLNKKA